MLKNKKSVIFDLDGTLIDSLWVWRQIDELYLEKKGIICEDNLQEALNGKSFTEAAKFFKETFSMDESIEEIRKVRFALCKRSTLWEKALVSAPATTRKSPNSIFSQRT